MIEINLRNYLFLTSFLHWLLVSFDTTRCFAGTYATPCFQLIKRLLASVSRKKIKRKWIVQRDSRENQLNTNIDTPCKEMFVLIPLYRYHITFNISDVTNGDLNLGLLPRDSVTIMKKHTIAVVSIVKVSVAVARFFLWTDQTARQQRERKREREKVARVGF